MRKTCVKCGGYSAVTSSGRCVICEQEGKCSNCLKIEGENKLLREALEKAPHTEYCEYWNECTCFKKVLK